MIHNRGFTSIELVIVIVILGVLSAIALPRFINLNRGAEQSVFDTYYGSLKSSIEMYHLSWQVKGKPNGAFGNFASIPSLTGYPSGGNDLNTAFESDGTTIWRDLLQGEVVTLGFITANNGWSSSVSNDEWVRNAGQVSALGESEDIYCHFIHTASYFSGSFDGYNGSESPLFNTI